MKHLTWLRIVHSETDVDVWHYTLLVLFATKEDQTFGCHHQVWYSNNLEPTMWPESYTVTVSAIIQRHDSETDKGPTHCFSGFWFADARPLQPLQQDVGVEFSNEEDGDAVTL